MFWRRNKFGQNYGKCPESLNSSIFRSWVVANEKMKLRNIHFVFWKYIWNIWMRIKWVTRLTYLYKDKTRSEVGKFVQWVLPIWGHSHLSTPPSLVEGHLGKQLAWLRSHSPPCHLTSACAHQAASSSPQKISLKFILQIWSPCLRHFF